EARVRGELERHRDRLGQLATEQLELDHRLRAIEIDDAAAAERKVAAIDRIAMLERVQLDLVAGVTAHRDPLEAPVAALTEARVRAAQLGEKRAAAEAAALRLAAGDAELAARAERLAAEIEDSAQRAAELRAGCDALAAELDGVRVQRSEQAGELER